METLIIRLGERSGRLNEFIKVKGDSLYVGRAMSSDLVLSDPYIAPSQVKFYREDQQWNLEVLDFTNPVNVNDDPVTNEQPIHKILSGDTLSFGRSHFVLMAADHPTEAIRTMVLSRWLHHRFLRPVLPVLMLTLACAIAGFSDYLSTVSAVKWEDFGIGSMVLILIALAWAGQWALTGRLLHHQPHFFAQLFYTSFILAAVSVVGFFEGYVEYVTNSIVLEDFVTLGSLFVLMAALLKYNLTFATHIHKKWAVSFSVAGLCMAFILGFSYLNDEDFKPVPEYSAVLRPPLVKLMESQNLSTFMSDFDNLFDIVNAIIDEEEEISEESLINGV